MDLTDALARFERAQAEQLSKTTIAGYRSAVRALVGFGIDTTRHLTRSKLAEWIAKRQREDLAPATINVQLAAILSIASWLERQELFPLGRLVGLRRLRLRQAPPPAPVFLLHDEVAQLRVAALAVDHGLELAITFAIFAGLRMNELRRIHREDLAIDGADADTPFIRVLRSRGETKTKKSRVVPIARAFAADLRRRDLPPGPVFPRRHPDGREIYVSRERLQTWLRTARDASELWHCTWFTLRHCFASYLRQGGVELSKISGWMGNTVRICEAFYAAMGPGGDRSVEKGFVTAGPAAAPIEIVRLDPDVPRMTGTAN